MHPMQFTPQRIDKVHRAMQHESVDAVLITRKTDVQYLTGYGSVNDSLPVGCVLVDSQQPYLIVSDLQREAMGQESTIAKVRSFDRVLSEDWYPTHGPGFWDCVFEVLKEAGAKNAMLGIQHDALSMRDFDGLKSALPGAGFKDFSKALWRLRQIKDAAEIDAIRQAVRISEIGVRTALETVVGGKTEAQSSIEIEAAMRGAGGELRGIRAAVLAGNHARFPFAQPTATRVNTNELVVVDITVSHSGYLVEVARTVHAGTPSAGQRKLFDSALAISTALQDLMAPDAKISDAATQAMRMVKSGPPAIQIMQPIGSSVGLDVHEPPYIIPESKSTLREGMVFSVHPTVYDSEAGCAKIADVLLITSDGCESLTGVSRETL